MPTSNQLGTPSWAVSLWKIGQCPVGHQDQPECCCYEKSGGDFSREVIDQWDQGETSTPCVSTAFRKLWVGSWVQLCCTDCLEDAWKMACKSQLLAPLRPGENAWVPCTRFFLLSASAVGAVRPALPLSPFYTSVCIADEISIAGPAVDKGCNSQDPLCCGCQQNKAVMASSRESELCFHFIFNSSKS